MRERISTARDSAAKGVRNAYNAASDYPGTIAAVVVGLAITGVLVWAARRAGGWRNLQDQAKERVREGYDYAREGVGKARDMYRERFTGSSSPAPIAE
jgi:predicted Rdx family selenoprotein